MPEFILNTSNAYPTRKRGNATLGWSDMNDFERGYIEALFFTNGDTGDEDEFRLNDLGVRRLTQAAFKSIHADCERFQRENAGELHSAWCERGGDYDEEQQGRDFWFTRQGHGVGFWDRNLGAAGDALTAAAHGMGEAYVEISDRGWIHHR